MFRSVSSRSRSTVQRPTTRSLCTPAEPATTPRARHNPRDIHRRQRAGAPRTGTAMSAGNGAVDRSAPARVGRDHHWPSPAPVAWHRILTRGPFGRSGPGCGTTDLRRSGRRHVWRLATESFNDRPVTEQPPPPNSRRTPALGIRGRFPGRPAHFAQYERVVKGNVPAPLPAKCAEGTPIRRAQ
jgi:hypothetical protein